MGTNKDLCVFTPCYNCEKYLERMHQSLNRQSYKCFDIVLVDDGSTDNSYTIMNRLSSVDPRIKVYRNKKNLGLGITRNLMFEYCKDYKYIAIMDADDIAPENRFEIELRYLEDHPDTTCVSGIIQAIDENDELGRVLDDGIRKYEDIKRIMVFKNTIANGTVMMRMRDVLESNIRYREQYVCAQDYRFYSELMQTHEIIKLPYILQFYRCHDSNVTATSVQRKNERDRLIDDIHEFNFESSGLRMTALEKVVFKRGFRDTSDRDFLFRIIFSFLWKLFKRKHSEYRDLF